MHITGYPVRHGGSPHFLWGKHLQCILNIRKVRIGSNMQCFEFFGQPSIKEVFFFPVENASIDLYPLFLNSIDRDAV
jgi:hypothetical protein